MGKVFLSLIIGLLLVFVGAHYFRTAPLEEKAIIEAGIQQARRDGHDLNPQQESLLRLQLAILDYIGKKGEPPNSLSDLVGTYFDAMPRDPETNKPFEYSKKGRSYELAGLQGLSEVGKANTPADPTQVALQTSQQSPEEFINPNLLPKETFIYDPSGKKDPFLPFDFSARPNKGNTPLESFALNQLRLTAVLADQRLGSSAIVEDASGRGYTVKIGTRIGDQNGTVVEILPDMLKILETNVDFTGKEEQRVVEMKIQASADHEDKSKSKRAAANRKKSTR